ncbi:hypothetical protein TREMEDRAFT_24846 [Tremella mesenterica DSM 1558]|uniref:uncharacterized protein n=1 Tax=Tremella mesenterica (strain ATCC 24925 / CBS 8224 / DSM 1558 / NBRC 9311 / NRRL Y-6157 / RJB 2259-6 / UBC 559-6) TaxID=578456 RepID=UPI0003F4A466|nr:uncharacterized protein TREMEDRAFT_24846 [Tremella mesenterica DSM 1558]EIW73272.1 hypothetical protein TREMEDRAFT_24846 [Tremella mesenterica DSM 1558]
MTSSIAPPIRHRPHTRLSLQPPAGLPSPIPSPTQAKGDSCFVPSLETVSPTSAMSAHKHIIDLGDDADCDAPENNTLMSCLTNMSLSSLPMPPALGNDEDDDDAEQRRIYLGPKLSDRATGGPDAGPLIERFSCLFRDQYDCKANPTGIVSLGVAENFLMEKECLQIFKLGLLNNFLSSDLSYGDSLWGSRRINKALSSFYNEWFDPAEEVMPEHLITGVGCSAVLDQLFYTLMDEGEAILLAAPYYTGFDRDLIGRGRVQLIPVYVPEGDGGFSPSSLDAFEVALAQCEKKGVIVRAVIVCNPQNPLGRTYSRETLLAYAKFCEEKDLHLVSDEIYALSVYDNPHFPHAVPFTSMLSLDVANELGCEFDRARLHVVHGMSKDFCANGLRVGALISQNNPLLLRAMANTSMLMKISSPADVIYSSLLTDKEQLHQFIELNRAKLGEAHAYIRNWFEERGVKVADSNAGHFVWVDLGGKLKFRDTPREKRVFQSLLDGGVYIAPGTAYHNKTPGWYRVTFSVSRDNLQVGLAKMERILGLYPHPK